MNNKTIPQTFFLRHKEYGDRIAQMSRNKGGEFVSLTFNQMWDATARLVSSMKKRGISAGGKIAIISENRPEWLQTNLAILSLGAIDVPRGLDTTQNEIHFILSHAECPWCFVETESIAEKILAKKPPTLKTLITYEPTGITSTKSLEVITFTDLLKEGKEIKAARALLAKEMETQNASEPATIIYTSGTTGTPKGVTLTHQNFLFQLEKISPMGLITINDIALCILPIWHSLERIVNYLGMYNGATLVYSKPISPVILADIAEVRPTIMVGIPRIWEGFHAGILRNVKKSSIIRKGLFYFFLGVGLAFAHASSMVKGWIPGYIRKRSRLLDIVGGLIIMILLSPFQLLGNILVFKKLHARLGGRFKLGVSGGGALPEHTNHFFQAVGIPLLEGYGLTETAPVISLNTPHRNVIGTVGQPLPEVEIKVVNEEGRLCNPGEMGELIIRSPQVMKGYYKNEEETNKVLSADGWLATGDLVTCSHGNDIRIIGRKKDTIVLRTGKNIEPEPIETAICHSPLIDNAVVVGQDQNILAALIVANEEMTESFAKEHNLPFTSWAEFLNNPQFKQKIKDEVRNLVNVRVGFHQYEMISDIAFLPKKLEVGKELGLTLKVKRFVIHEHYKDIIKNLFR